MTNGNLKTKRYNDGIFNIRHFLPAELRIRVSKEKIAEIFDRLSLKEQMALALKYGLNEGKPHNYRQIGDIMGLTKDGAHKLTKRSLKKLIRQLR